MSETTQKVRHYHPRNADIHCCEDCYFHGNFTSCKTHNLQGSRFTFVIFNLSSTSKGLPWRNMMHQISIPPADVFHMWVPHPHPVPPHPPVILPTVPDKGHHDHHHYGSNHVLLDTVSGDHHAINAAHHHQHHHTFPTTIDVHGCSHAAVAPIDGMTIGI